jgi:hypothetical protein
MARSIQARLDAEADALLRRLKRATGLSDSELVRRGLEALAQAQPGGSAERVVGVGQFDSGVDDLGSNKRHLRGFGKS